MLLDSDLTFKLNRNINQQIEKYQMPSLISAISLFPEKQFWKVGERSELKHTCGGIVSIFLFVIIGIIFVVKLRDAFQKQTMWVIEEDKIVVTGILANISTSQIPQSQPIMVAVDTKNGLYQASAQIKSPRLQSIAGIRLQTCTIAHFANTHNIQELATVVNISSYLCLPVNQTYEIGGHRFSIDLKSLTLSLICTNATLCGKANPNLNIFIESSLLNPNNNTQFWSPSIRHFSYKYSPFMKCIYFQFIKNTLHEDSSIMPFQNKKIKTEGFQLDTFIKTQDDQPIAGTGLTLDFTTSQKQNVYHVRYLTILDVLSYVGGIFNSLLGFFFFIVFYGQSFVEFFIARQYFKDKHASSFGFFSFIKQTVFGICKNLGFKPQWQLAQQRQEVQKVVQNMMNVIYLHRRIQFLQRAISVLLEPHQLKGLHLINHQTVQQADEKFKSHQYQDRLTKYFKRRRKMKHPNSTNSSQSKMRICNESGTNFVKSMSLFEKHTAGDPVLKGCQSLYSKQKNQISTEQNIAQQIAINDIIQEQEEEVEKNEEKDEQIEDIEKLYTQFEQQLSKDLKCLIEQSSQKNTLSKKIALKIDPNVLQKIKTAIHQQQKYKFRYDINAQRQPI